MIIMSVKNVYYNSIISSGGRVILCIELYFSTFPMFYYLKDFFQSEFALMCNVICLNH